VPKVKKNQDFIIIAKNSTMHLVITGDGSHTLYVPQLNEHYHSTFGALTESMHVFIKAGLGFFTEKKKIIILEIGFGTGLNALLSCLTAIDKDIRLSYYALEKYPVSLNIVNQLNYAALLFHNNPVNLFTCIHEAPWNTMSTIHPCFHLHKIQADLTEFLPDFSYDLIFFDAFAPEKQPEMWSAEIFKRLFENLTPGGIITTYCVKGEVKRRLISAGFIIEKLPGPPGKREILRGTKKVTSNE
jgi:tRNA U34 5-methylaminomethyl-2-thiouridine-forming methyltransferase MnmC